jgi:hypothetical protein
MSLEVLVESQVVVESQVADVARERKPLSSASQGPRAASSPEKDAAE